MLATVTVLSVPAAMVPPVSASAFGEICVCEPVMERLSEVTPPPKTVSRLVTLRSARKVCAVLVAVAAALSTKLFASVMEKTVAPAGMPVPVMPMPTTMPVVPPAVSETVPAAVAGWFRVMDVPGTIAVITEPAGMPVPVIGMPTARPVVLTVLTVAEPATVVEAATATLVAVTLAEAAVVATEPTLNAPDPKT